MDLPRDFDLSGRGHSLGLRGGDRFPRCHPFEREVMYLRRLVFLPTGVRECAGIARDEVERRDARGAFVAVKVCDVGMPRCCF